MLSSAEICSHNLTSCRCRRADCDDEEDSSSSVEEEEEESEVEEEDSDQEGRTKEEEERGAENYQEAGEGERKFKAEATTLNDEGEIEGFTDLAVRMNPFKS